MLRKLLERPWARATTWKPCMVYLSGSGMAILAFLVMRGGRP